MYALSRKFLGFAAAGGLALLTLTTTPALAGDTVQSLGPVTPGQPILATVGGKQVIAFFASNNGQCHVQMVLWNADDVEARSAGAVRVSLNPGQTASIDGSENESFTLKCGDNAETLASIHGKQQFAAR
jgi:hypothetical protein